MRFSLLPILTIVTGGFDSPLHARGYKASLNTRREFHDAVQYICTRPRCEFRTTTPKKDNKKQCIVNNETLELGYHQFVKTAEFVRAPHQRPAPSPLPKKRPATQEDPQDPKRQKQ
ncbi:hypothetical protein DFP72DRAFT_922463 [Ephemerocybe angulata]|uniref:Uncharacterized protein n=1 Tax=Ephemerocybe angulata TaxID=980116 RepID=A0A8H6HHU7_9AGAR|nr:hypothetical protein DFP72DRAFT_922463 [Tulosesus angulatus]